MSNEIKLDKKERKLLSGIDKTSKWEDVKDVKEINDEIINLDIYKEFIGLGCSKYLNDSAETGKLDVEEMFRNCREAEKIRLRTKKKERKAEGKAGKSGMVKGNVGNLTRQNQQPTEIDSKQVKEKDKEKWSEKDGKELSADFFTALIQNGFDIYKTFIAFALNYGGKLCAKGFYGGIATLLNGLSKQYEKITGIGYQDEEWLMSPDIYKGITELAKKCGIVVSVASFLSFMGWRLVNTSKPPRSGKVPKPTNLDPNVGKNDKKDDDDDDDEEDDMGGKGGGKVKSDQDLAPKQQQQDTSGLGILYQMLQGQNRQYQNGLINTNIGRLFQQNADNPIKVSDTPQPTADTIPVAEVIPDPPQSVDTPIQSTLPLSDNQITNPVFSSIPFSTPIQQTPPPPPTQQRNEQTATSLLPEMTTGFFAGLGLAGMGGISNVLRPMPDVAGLNQLNDIVDVGNVDNLLGNMDNFQLQPTPQLTPDQLNLMNPVLNRDGMIQPLYNRQNIGIQAQPPQAEAPQADMDTQTDIQQGDMDKQTKQLKDLQEELQKKEAQERENQKKVNDAIEDMEIRGRAWGLFLPQTGGAKTIDAGLNSLSLMTNDVYEQQQNLIIQQEQEQQSLLGDIQQQRTRNKNIVQQMNREQMIAEDNTAKLRKQIELQERLEGQGGLGYDVDEDEDRIIQEQRAIQEQQEEQKKKQSITEKEQQEVETDEDKVEEVEQILNEEQRLAEQVVRGIGRPQDINRRFLIETMGRQYRTGYSASGAVLGNDITFSQVSNYDFGNEQLNRTIREQIREYRTRIQKGSTTSKLTKNNIEEIVAIIKRFN